MPTKSQGCNPSSIESPLSLRHDEEVLLCQICEQSGDGIVQCSGPCLGMYHIGCTGHSSHDGSYLCEECYTGEIYAVLCFAGHPSFVIEFFCLCFIAINWTTVNCTRHFIVINLHSV